jgi:hypothetical protein
VGEAQTREWSQAPEWQLLPMGGASDLLRGLGVGGRCLRPLECSLLGLQGLQPLGTCQPHTSGPPTTALQGI